MAVVEFREISTCEEKAEFKDINRRVFPVVYDDEFYDTMLLKSSYHAVLVWYGNQAIGTLSFETEKQTVYVFTFGILQRFRGMGLGEEAWTKAEETLQSTFQCNRIRLHVQTSNLKAVGFYRKQGFAAKEAVDDYYEGLPCNSAYLLEKCI